MNAFLRKAMLAAAFAAALSAPAAARDRDAAGIIDSALESYLESIKDVRDYTIETPGMVVYHRKTSAEDGVDYFETSAQLKIPLVPGQRIADAAAGIYGLFGPGQADYLRENARYEGLREADGYRTHALFIERLPRAAGGGAENVRLYLDEENFLVRKATMEYTLEASPGRVVKLTPEIYPRDYREAGGMMIPYRTDIIADGLAEAFPPDQLERATAALEEFEKQLGRLPPEQRQLIESMMRPHIDMFEKLLETDTVTLEVTRVRVNTGLGDELFEQPAR